MVSIITDQIQDIIGYSAIDISKLTLSEINQECNFKVMFVGAEKVKEKTFRQILTDQSSLLHLCCCIAHVSMANRFSVLKVTSQNYSGLEKFFEIKTFLEPAFPTVI